MQNGLRQGSLLLTTFVVIIIGGRIAAAQVVLKPTGQNGVPLRAKSLTANVLVEKTRFATCDLDLVFANDISSRVEADFLYTVPDGAVVTDFAYFYGTERVPARVAEKERAAAIYKHITTRQRDPALVEMVGKNTFRARIFPVEPNADLRVQIRYVQVLPANASGAATIAVPLQTPKSVKWDSVSVAVRVTGDPYIQVRNNFGIAAQPVESRRGGGSLLSFRGTNYRTDKDMRVSLAPPKGASETPCLAAPSSGGGDGFFAAVLTAPEGARLNGHLQSSGVSVYAVATKRLAAQSVLVTGRYHKPGAARLTMETTTGQRVSGLVALGSAAIPNSPATKFWAAARIERLSERGAANRAQIVALSKRFTLPSRYTSWIAIPVEERKRYAREKAQAELSVIAAKLYAMKRHGRGQESGAVALRAQFYALCRTAGYSRDLPEVLNEHMRNLASEEIERAAQDAASAVAAHGKNSAAARNAYATLVRWCRDTGTSPRDTLRHAVENEMYRAEMTVVAAVAAGKSEVAARGTYRRLQAQLGKTSGHGLHYNLLYAAENKAREWARAHHGEELYWNWDSTYQTYPFRVPPDETERLRAQVVRLARAAGENPDTLFADAEQPWNRKTLWEKRNAVVTARRDKPTEVAERERDYLAEARSENQQVVAAQSRYFYDANTPDGRESFAKDRLTRLAARAEAESLEAQLQTPLAPEEADAIKSRAELLRGTETRLRARMGDPLLFVDAPKAAQSVVAVLPGGEIVPLAWDDAARRWQCRFDIPTYAAEGDYTVTVTITLADGSTAAQTFSYTVDTTVPQATLSAARTADTGVVRVEVIGTDTDISRAVVILPSGETVSMTPDTAKPGRFWARVATAADTVTVVLTDRAHNRATLSAQVTP